ncbi:carcinoembryonic antigen-related cell adhesion molecule 7-like, partial [Chrysemys picta bellii]|uniref:carcinoembryonic antigen-related cell adhesion molecule 7-like n=1 Tax=Chrysemys picta bellii TaxID=8478 RepID=UPI0032B255E8
QSSEEVFESTWSLQLSLCGVRAGNQASLPPRQLPAGPAAATGDGRIPHRPGGPWTGILLAASVLGSCLQPAPAQTPVTIVLTPPSPVVGGGVSLAPQPPPENLVLCSWFRSATAAENSRILSYNPATSPPQTPGPAHTGRETAGPSCALNIAGLTLNDTGNYTVQIQTPAFLSIPVTLRVYARGRGADPGGLSGGHWDQLASRSRRAGARAGGWHLPRELANAQIPRAGSDQAPGEARRGQLMAGEGGLCLSASPGRCWAQLWLQDGSSLVPSEWLGLSPDNRTLTVLGVTRGDAGAYQCEVGNPVSTNRSEPSTVTLACTASI